VPGSAGPLLRGLLCVGDGPDDLTPILGAPAVVHAARLLVDLVGNVMLSGSPQAREQAARLCAGLPVDAGADDDGGCPEIVLLHEACRPLAPVAVGSAVLHAVLAGEAAAVPVLPLTDTVKQVAVDGCLRGTVDRALLRIVQAPVAFRTARVPAVPCDPLDLVRQCAASGQTVRAVPGHPAAAPLRSVRDLEQLLVHRVGPCAGPGRAAAGGEAG